MADQFWYKDAVFYEVPVRAFKDSNGDGHGDLRGLMEKLDYLQQLGVDCLWLLPIYVSPLRDDGYDIADYYAISQTFGDTHDLEALIAAAHARNIRIIMDLVLNHTSDEHPWFKAARSSRESTYRDYYVWSDTDRKYKEARIIFVDTESSNWTWDESSGQYYWHRFYASQPDLNYDNPAVQDEMLRIAGFWLELGIDGFRADAVPYLFERDGTNCENLPETHIYLKKIRSYIDKYYPGRILLCEANQWPEDVRPYFGDGDEFQMGFNFPVMPRIFMALKKGNAEDLLEILRRTPAIPDNCQWCTFLRNHDELTLEMVTPEEREWMWQQYAPDPRMRLNLGIRRRLAPLLDNDRRKIELAHSLLFTLPGSPILYYGDEIGMGDNLDLPDRNGVRTPMQWDNSAGAGFTTGKAFTEFVHGDYDPQHVNVAGQIADDGSLWHRIQGMINTRKLHSVFGRGTMQRVDMGNPAILGYTRQLDGEALLVINNLQDTTQTAMLLSQYSGGYRDLLSGKSIGLESQLRMDAYEYLWLQRED